MTYRVELGSSAERVLQGYSPELNQRIISALEGLAVNPRPRGARKLAGREGYRFRIGDYRVLYVIDDTHHLVQVYRIGHRREVYRR